MAFEERLNKAKQQAAENSGEAEELRKNKRIRDALRQDPRYKGMIGIVHSEELITILKYLDAKIRGKRGRTDNISLQITDYTEQPLSYSLQELKISVHLTVHFGNREKHLFVYIIPEDENLIVSVKGDIDYTGQIDKRFNSLTEFGDFVISNIL